MKFIILSLFILNSVYASGVLGPKTAIFVIPQIGGDDLKNSFIEDETENLVEDAKDVVEDVVKETDDGYTITIPIKNDEGEYELVDIEYTEVDGARTISIPGEGDITIIEDENGNYNFELTPEQIKDADNVSCSINTAGESKCTIKPFVTMVGSKILTADELVLDYKEGENLKVIGGDAKNLKLTDEDSASSFNKSEVDTGDTRIDIKFSKQGENSTSPVGLDRFLNPFKQTDSILDTPSEFKQAAFFQISLSTSKMIQTVTNPNDRSQSATRLEVKDGGGVNSEITFRNSDQSNINIRANTTDGVKYIPKPFSKNPTIIETTAPVSANFSMDTESNKASLSLVMSDVDKNGNASELSITEKNVNGDVNTITAYGSTGINVTQGLLTDGKDKNGNPKVNPNSPVAFEMISDKIVSNNKDSKGNETDITVNGLKITGVVDTTKKTGIAQANVTDINYITSKNGVLKNQTILGDGIQLAILETDDKRKLNAQSGYAYFNNGRVEANLAGGIFVDAQEAKNKNTAEVIDGKALQRNIIITGASGTVDDGENLVSIENDFVFQEQQFFNGSKKYLFAGSDASVGSEDYDVALNDGFIMQTNLDQDKNLKDFQLQGSTLKVKDNKSNDMFELVESATAINKENDITSFSHTSQGLKYSKGESSELIDASQLNVSGVDANEIKYGAISFDEVNYKKDQFGEKKFSENIKISDLSAAFYIDDSDPNNPYKTAMADVGSVNLVGSDYQLDIMAKDKDGNDSKFSLIFIEEGNNKSYKIFGADGRLVHVKGEEHGDDIPDIIFESISYFESDEFKQIAGKKISGELVTLDSKDDKLQTFNLARINGVESINGDFRQVTFEDGAFSEFDYKSNTNTFLTAQSGNFLETNTDGIQTRFVSVNDGNISQTSDSESINLDFTKIIGSEIIDKDGNKVTALSIEQANGEVVNSDDKLNVQGTNINAVKADKIQYGNLSFDSASAGKGLIEDGKYGENIQLTGMNAVYYIDETNPGSKIVNGEATLETLSASNSDYNVSMIAKDENGVEKKFTVFFMQDGDKKSYKIFAEDGGLVHISGEDKKGNVLAVVFKSIELFESDEFRQLAILEMSGSLQTIDSNDDRLTNFSIARFDGYENKNENYKQYIATEFSVVDTDHVKDATTNLNLSEAVYVEGDVEDGRARQLDIKSGNVSLEDNKRTVTADFDSISAGEFTNSDGKKTKTIDLKINTITSIEDSSKSNIDNLNLNIVESEEEKTGSVQFDKGTYINGLTNNDKFKDKIELTDVSAVFYINDSDPNNKFVNAFVDLGDVKVVGADYNVNIIAKDENGIDKSFSIYFLEDGINKTVKVFSEDGKLIHISGQEKGKNLPDIVFESIDYFESDKFKQFAGTKIAGELKTANEVDDKLQLFSVARIEGIQSIDGDNAEFLAHDGKLQEFDYKTGQDTSFQFERMKFSKNNTFDFEQLTGEVTNGVVDFVEYKKNSKDISLSVNSKVKSLIGSKITAKNGDVITMVKSEGIELLAVDYEELKKVSAKIGSLNYYDDKNITSIDLQNIEELKLEDLSSGGIFEANAQRVLRVVERDDNGKEIGSYLLMNKAFLNYNDKSKGINADIRVGVLELMQDKLNDQNIALKIDIEGKITLDKSPVGGEVKFAVKGSGLTVDSDSYTSEDGGFSKGEFSINTQGIDGGIENMNLSAGPDFMKNLIEFKANGGKDGGRRILTTYSYDKKNAVRSMNIKFVEGEKVSLKLGPFKIKTEKTKDGAQFDAELRLKGQSMEVQLNEISELIGTQKVNSWLGVSPGGFITVRTGTALGLALEAAYKPGETNMGLGYDAKASSLGLSIVKVSDNGDEAATGLYFTGSSEFNIKTNKGHFEIMGIKQDKEANLPGVINLAYKKKYSDGDGFIAGISYDLTGLLVDDDYINPSAAYFDKGRVKGGAGVNFAYRNALSETSAITLAIGANEGTSFCKVSYTAHGIDPLGDTVLGIRNVLNGMPFSTPNKRAPARKRRTGAQEREIDRLNKEIDEIETRYNRALLVEKFEKALNGNYPFTDLIEAEFKLFSEIEIDLKSASKEDSLVSKMSKSPVYSNQKTSEEDKLDWLVSQTIEHKENLDLLYKDKKSFNIYVEYLQRYNRLRDLNYTAKSIR